MDIGLGGVSTHSSRGLVENTKKIKKINNYRLLIKASPVAGQLVTIFRTATFRGHLVFDNDIAPNKIVDQLIGKPLSLELTATDVATMPLLPIAE